MLNSRFRDLIRQTKEDLTHAGLSERHPVPPRRVCAGKRRTPQHPHCAEHHLPLCHQRGHGEPCSTWRRAATSTPACRTPPTDRVAAKICALEGGTAAMLTSSGQAANFLRHLQHLSPAGDHVVASATIYGGTYQPLRRDHEAHGHRVYLCGPRLLRGGAGCRLPAQHQGRLWRDHRQPRPDRAGPREVRQGRPQPRRAPHRGQHLRHPHQLPARSSGGRTS